MRTVIELASFSPFSITHQAFLDQLPESIGLMINTIEANTLTENLLRQSQSLAEELRSQQEELRSRTPTSSVRRACWPNGTSRRNTRTSKSTGQALARREGRGFRLVEVQVEFIANMSHELRTPLNSLLISPNNSTTTPRRT